MVLRDINRFERLLGKTETIRANDDWGRLLVLLGWCVDDFVTGAFVESLVGAIGVLRLRGEALVMFASSLSYYSNWCWWEACWQLVGISLLTILSRWLG